MHKFKCKHIYFDVGTNTGVQIRKLFEPQLYATDPMAATTRKVYSSLFGTEPHCSTCAIGFDPNPRHYDSLIKLQASLRKAGAGVLIFHAAASDVDGISHLALKKSGRTSEDLGATLSDTWQGMGHAGSARSALTRVRSVDLARIIHAVRGRQTVRGRMLAKMDIEGSELQVLPHLVRSQALCTLDAVRIEWHSRYWARAVSEQAARLKKLPMDSVGAKAIEYNAQVLQQLLEREFKRNSSDCKVRIIEADDESFSRSHLALTDRCDMRS